jgi:hypothetical protein
MYRFTRVQICEWLQHANLLPDACESRRIVDACKRWAETENRGGAVGLSSGRGCHGGKDVPAEQVRAGGHHVQTSPAVLATSAASHSGEKGGLVGTAIGRAAAIGAAVGGEGSFENAAEPTRDVPMGGAGGYPASHSARDMPGIRVLESGSAIDEEKQEKRIGGIKVLTAGKGGALGCIRTAEGEGSMMLGDLRVRVLGLVHTAAAEEENGAKGKEKADASAGGAAAAPTRKEKADRLDVGDEKKGDSEGLKRRRAVEPQSEKGSCGGGGSGHGDGEEGSAIQQPLYEQAQQDKCGKKDLHVDADDTESDDDDHD